MTWFCVKWVLFPSDQQLQVILLCAALPPHSCPRLDCSTTWVAIGVYHLKFGHHVCSLFFHLAPSGFVVALGIAFGFDGARTPKLCRHT